MYDISASKRSLITGDSTRVIISVFKDTREASVVTLHQLNFLNNRIL